MPSPSFNNYLLHFLEPILSWFNREVQVNFLKPLPQWWPEHMATGYTSRRASACTTWLPCVHTLPQCVHSASMCTHTVSMCTRCLSMYTHCLNVYILCLVNDPDTCPQDQQASVLSPAHGSQMYTHEYTYIHMYIHHTHVILRTNSKMQTNVLTYICT